MTQPFRFGALEVFGTSGKDWAERARVVEGSGFSTLQMVDHLGFMWSPGPALSAAAAVTETLRVGSQVFANDYRHPVQLAKDAATIDLISDGRLELGIGAGWSVGDYQAMGIPFDPPKVRIDRLEEAITIIKGCFGDDIVNFEGEHYTITDYAGQPKPAQPNGPPLLIGGGGKRMLRIAGREVRHRRSELRSTVECRSRRAHAERRRDHDAEDRRPPAPPRRSTKRSSGYAKAPARASTTSTSTSPRSS